MSNRCLFSPHPLTSAFHLPQRRRFHLHPITSAARRRHLRRRHLKHSPNSNSNPTLPIPNPLPTIFKLSDDTLHISLTSFHETANHYLDFTRDAWDDLRTAVVVDRTNGAFTISCRRSTVKLAAALLLSSLVLVVAVRGLFRSRKTGGEVLVYKRDRSLGGREVVVAKREMSSRELVTPLSKDSVKDYEVRRKREALELDRRRRRRRKAELPEWWPQVVSFGTDDDGTVNKEEYQRLVNMLVKGEVHCQD